MNKKGKIIGFVGLVGGALLLTACNSFCSENDVSNYLYNYDPVNTTFFETEEQGTNFILDTFKNTQGIDASRISTSTLKVDVYDPLAEHYVRTDYDVSYVLRAFNTELYALNSVKITALEATEPTAESNRNDVSIIFGLNSFTASLLDTAAKQGIMAPNLRFWQEFDDIFLNYIETKNNTDKAYSWLKDVNLSNITYAQMNGYTYEDLQSYKNDPTKEKLEKILNGNSTDEAKSSELPGRYYSYLTTLGHNKFFNEEDSYTEDNKVDYYSHITKWNDELVANGTLEASEVMSGNFLALYQNTLAAKVNTLKTCITVNDGFYGHTSDDPINDSVLIEGKGQDFYQGWGDAFAKHGFLEGLFVYPIATMTENFAHAFGMNGGGQILAVLLTTLIIRLLFMLVTLPSTLSQQKMQMLQPEISKLQQKYPNANTNQYEKQKMQQAQMALYKKYKVRPALTFLTLIVQFPVFISVWNALQGSASLSSDAFLGLRLSDTIWSVLSNFAGRPGNGGWWTALVLILLMSGGQVCAMFVPQWLNKKRNKSIQKLGKSNTQQDQNKTMKMTQWIMTIFIIIMGFNLPSAMGVYWFAGALFNIIQSVIMHFVLLKRLEKRG